MVSKKKVFFILYITSIVAFVLVGSLVITQKFSFENPIVLGQMISSPTIIPTVSPRIPTPTTIPISIVLSDVPKEITEGDTVTFTWNVNGPSQVLRKTTIYYGTTSDPQMFNTNLDPENSPYTHSISDFMQGRYLMPLQFIASAKDIKSGTYYYRGYAFIKGKHYWTNQNSFVVKEGVKSVSIVIDPPSVIKKGENTTFTWDISGPQGKAEYTSIVIAKESRPGSIDNTIGLEMTPYKHLTTEFTTGTHDIPLRFIGNTKVDDEGTYYYRALAKIDGKNIWSEEYSLKVE